MSYDTLTAWVKQPYYYPDPKTGWRPVNVQTKFDEETGDISHEDKWVWNHEGYDFTLYPDGRLELQISVPRVIAGDNVNPWVPVDPDDAFDTGNIISLEVRKRLGVNSPPWVLWGEKFEGGVYRLDADRHYELGSDDKVMAVRNSLMKVLVPGYPRFPHTGENSSATWGGSKGCTRKYMVYGKSIEVMEKYHNPELAKRAEGILRAEAMVRGGRAVAKLLTKPLKLEGKNDSVSVQTVMRYDHVPVISKKILGRLPELVEQTIGGITMKNVPGLQEITEELGIQESAKYIGLYVMVQQMGEKWLRGKASDRTVYYRMMKRLSEKGYDPRRVNLNLGAQLKLREGN